MNLAQLIPESTPHCLLVLDENLKLVYGNSNFHRFVDENFGISLKLGDSLLSKIPEDKRSVYQLQLKEILTGQCARVEQTIEINGFTRHFDVTYQPLEMGSTWDKIVITFDEITNRKRREIRLLDEDEHLREALATRETLLSVISHDLRSPVFQLNGLLFLIRQASEARDEARLQMHAEDLEERISHLTHTLDNLLSWSSLQRQSLEPRIRRFELQPVFNHAIGLLKPFSSKKDLRVYTQGLRGVELVSDSEMVAFIVRNLINNAIKFSNQSGKIEVQVSSLDDSVVFTVRDEGIGLPEEKLLCLQNEETVKSESGTWGERGTGLGLKLCHEFVNRLKGEIEFSSPETGGTLVTVTLPQLKEH